MALKLSTGLRNAILAKKAKGSLFQGATGALVIGGTGEDSITRSSGSFITDGFVPGMSLLLYGATTSANDTAVTGAVVTGVTDSALILSTGIVNTAESFAASTVLVGMLGSCFADIMSNGVARLYSGVQPASADEAETGTLLAKITSSGGAFTAGNPTNGLLFNWTASSGELTKLGSQLWSGVGLANGTCGYIRFYDNSETTGFSTTAIRFDCNVSTTSFPVKMPSTTITTGVSITIDSCKITMPAS